ncbi:MAG: 3-deoxy-8-phosphooctulonate synthase [Candidatus Omnitrophica bacterium CG1_02_46_14]|nr:MAG: 3-deoxy-8-phosphooctulonate synthase [Candidatus Omnitrophica bacterium CG1_02_46_14]
MKFGAGSPLALIAGPCVIENEKSALRHALAIKKIAGRLKIPYVYKSSYDKANRSSIQSFRGLGIDRGLEILRRVKDETGLPLLTDIHSIDEAEKASTVVDILQIPAFLCRQTDLLIAAAKTGKVVNVKKGQFLAPWDMKNIVHKIESAGSRKILLTERGTSFGYNTLVSDFRALSIMRELGYPVIFDATHSVQQPGGLGTSSGGERKFVPLLAQAAVAVGVDGIFMEVHENPNQAPSDGPNMIPLKSLEKLLERLMKLNRVVKNDN